MKISGTLVFTDILSDEEEALFNFIRSSFSALTENGNVEEMNVEFFSQRGQKQKLEWEEVW